MKSHLLALASIAIFAGNLLGQSGPVPTLVNDDNVMYFYETKAEIPTRREDLAKIISRDYRTAPDEFTGQELFQKVAPVIAKRIESARSTREVSVRIGGELPAYDFQRKGFSTGISNTTFIPFKNGYAIQYTQGSTLDLVEVPLEQAKTLSKSLGRTRRSYLTVFGTIEQAREQTLNFEQYKVIFLKPTRVVMELEGGVKVGEKAL